jgi:hypothetical protein
LADDLNQVDGNYGASGRIAQGVSESLNFVSKPFFGRSKIEVTSGYANN